MDLSTANLPNLILLVIWTMLWALGGVWISNSIFRLQRREKMLVGLILGFVSQIWLANLFCYLVDILPAFWLSAAVVFLAGLGLSLRSGWRSLFKLEIFPLQLFLLLGLIYVFMAIGRGLAIFDDFAFLPTVSVMAAGNIPVRFVLNPESAFNYHYFLLLFAAQIMRIGNFYVWTALDIARGVSFGLGILAVALWSQRITRSSLAGFGAGLMAAFGTGLRWLWLLMPDRIIGPVANSLQLLGSGVQTSPDFQTAIISNWVIEGNGPFAYPFAYVNGLSAPGVMAHGPSGFSAAAVIFTLLLTFNRWRNKTAALFSVILISSFALIDETMFGLLLGGWGMITLIEVIRKRSLRLPKSLQRWLLVVVVALLIVSVQGGTWSSSIQGFLGGLLSGGGDSGAYQEIGFQFSLIPTIVSSHLGVLSLGNFWQLLAALFEIGPTILVLPLLLLYSLKSLKAGRWFESALTMGGLLSLFFVFVQFSGSGGVRNTSRIYSFIEMSFMWFVPLVWIWVSRRSENWKASAAVLTFIIIFGGMVLFGVELVAAQKPIYSTWLTQLDRDFHNKYWNQLEEDALIFDSQYSRAPTVFGLYTNSSTYFYTEKPEWTALYDRPDPHDLQAAGFDYVYYDYVYDYEVKQRYGNLFADDCVVVVDEFQHKHTEDFRRLLDIRNCK